MFDNSMARHAGLGALIAASITLGFGFSPSALAAQPRSTASKIARPIGAEVLASAAVRKQVTLAIGNGQMLRLPAPMTDLFVADPTIADVQVRSATQLFVFGKKAGETTVYATDKGGNVLYAAQVQVGENLDSVGTMLKAAMPDALIQTTAMNKTLLLTGTVAAPEDIGEAQRLAEAYLGDGIKVISRLKTATPLQVNVQVRIAEVTREFSKKIGVNLSSLDTTGGFLFGVAQGRSAGSVSLNSTTGGVKYDYSGMATEGVTSFAGAGKFLGLNLLGVLDLGENDGVVTTLANPNLTALSGETASFLAGGEFPILISQAQGAVTYEYKSYGVSLAFTPVVLSDGRISMRVRPEVSQLTQAGAVKLDGYTIPGISTRRAETTVELGSGQSFMIGGLLQNSRNNSVDKTPGLGDLPILGALFRSKSFQNNETELMIVVTPYLVKPVSANQISLPTDGYRAPDDFQNFFGGQSFEGVTGGSRPTSKSAPPAVSGPDGRKTGAAGAPKLPTDPKSLTGDDAVSTGPERKDGSVATPGFSL